MTHTTTYAIEIVLLALLAVMSMHVADRELRTFTYDGAVYIVETEFIDAMRLAALCRGDSEQAEWYVATTREIRRMR